MKMTSARIQTPRNTAKDNMLNARSTVASNLSMTLSLYERRLVTIFRVAVKYVSSFAASAKQVQLAICTNLTCIESIKCSYVSLPRMRRPRNLRSTLLVTRFRAGDSSGGFVCHPLPVNNASDQKARNGPKTLCALEPVCVATLTKHPRGRVSAIH